MRWDKVYLKKDGLWVEEWDRAKKKTLIQKLPEVPDTSLLQAWKVPFRIQGVVRLRDLIAYLKSSPTRTNQIAALTGANLPAYLDQDLTPIPPKNDKDALQFIEVYTSFSLDNRRDLRQWDLEMNGNSAHGVGKKDKTWAIEFTPWPELMHLPLRVQNPVYFVKTTWEKDRPRRVGFVKKGATSIPRGTGWIRDRKSVSHETTKVTVTYTLGDFFTGLLDELCFFWTPATRNKKKEELNERFDEVDQAKKSGSNDFYELKEFPITKRKKK